MRKRCAAHGAQEVRLSADAAWYEATRAIAPRPYRPRAVSREVALGCPFDCGPCTSHTQKVRLPVVTITSACNLDCPICYVHNKNEDAFHMGARRVPARARPPASPTTAASSTSSTSPAASRRCTRSSSTCWRWRATPASIASPSARNGVRLARDEAFVAELAEPGRAHRAVVRHLRQARGRRAAGRAAAGDQAALPRPAREARRRHDADPGDDPRRERPRDRRHPAPRPRPPQHPPRRGPPDDLHRPGRRQLRSRRPHVDGRGAGAHRGDDRAAC